MVPGKLSTFVSAVSGDRFAVSHPKQLMPSTVMGNYMETYKGEPSNGKDFYSLLLQSTEFTSELGKVALASGQLEAEIILYFKRKDLKFEHKKATLGTLIRIGENEGVFDSNLLIAFKQSKKQRNEFMHNLYSLFIELVNEELLPRNNLLDSDVVTYNEYAWQLKENLEGLAEIISRK
ncbi:MAG: hypothetical protein Q8M15_06150 [Bacteroidota bacterium]|nr:hypothetical protein [Bacteroidota bacterium]